ncbi:threonine/serine ThrE exporter family protein [Limibacterium fermenti]|uniref:threonine/serine ThrE exporter family protein n=1 Tax=Limibacterium fermenti TaxID=3229863 RepID=UPI000E9DBCC6|nr:threonine/serine exporter [Porphyromonadaceae bacterium]
MTEDNSSKQSRLTAKQFAEFALDVGTYLLASGAHSGRLNTNIKRMGEAWAFEVQINSSFRGLLVSVQNKKDIRDSITLFKEPPPHSVHLAVLTDVSRMSWKVYEEKLSFEETEKTFQSIKQKKHYPPWLISLAVGFSCAGLCLLAKGDYWNAAVAYLAAFVGYFFQRKVSEWHFNAMISIGIAAFISTLITGWGYRLGIGSNPEAAMATGVLYLIPGVPLLNCVIDLIEGHLSSSVNRILFAGFILLCIAAGMTLSIALLGIDHFELI